MVFQPGQSGNPSGKPAQKFMTEALQLHLLRPADLPPHKPRNAAEAIAGQIVRQALAGDNSSQQLVYDRMEGKAIATIKAEIDTKPIDIMDAARRLAFIINSAQALGEPLPPDATPVPGRFLRRSPCPAATARPAELPPRRPAIAGRRPVQRRSGRAPDQLPLRK